MKNIRGQANIKYRRKKKKRGNKESLNMSIGFAPSLYCLEQPIDMEEKKHKLRNTHIMTQKDGSF